MSCTGDRQAEVALMPVSTGANEVDARSSSVAEQQHTRTGAVPDSSPEAVRVPIVDLGVEHEQLSDEAGAEQVDRVTEMQYEAAAEAIAGNVDAAVRLLGDSNELHQEQVGGGDRDDVFAARTMLKAHLLLEEAGRVDEAAARLADARGLLERAGEHVPELEALCLRAEGRALLAAGQPEQAERLCEQAVQLLAEHRDELAGELAAAQIDLACALADQARLQETHELVKKVMRAVAKVADKCDGFAVVARTMRLMVKVARVCGFVPRAAQVLEEEVQEQRNLGDSPWRATPLLQLAKLQLLTGKRDEAAMSLREARRVLPENHPSLVELAIVSAAVGDADEVSALERLGEAEAWLMGRYDDELHPAVLRVRLAKSKVMLREKPGSPVGVRMLVDALAMLGLVERDASRMRWTTPKRAPEARHVGVAVELLRAYATAQLEGGGRGGLAAAVLAYETAVAILPAKSWLRLPCLVELGYAYVRYGREVQQMHRAREPLLHALRITGDKLLDADCDVGHVSLLQLQFGWTLARMERMYAGAAGRDAAVPRVRKVVALAENFGGFAARDLAELHYDAGMLLTYAGSDSLDEGLALLQRATASFKTLECMAEHVRSLETVGRALQYARRWEEAGPLLQDAHALAWASLGPTERSTSVTIAWVRGLVHLGQYDEAQGVVTRALELTEHPCDRANLRRMLEIAKPPPVHVSVSLWQRFRRALSL